MDERRVERLLRLHAPEGPRPEVRERLMAEAATRLRTVSWQGTAAPRVGLVWVAIGLLLCANWGVNAYYSARVGRVLGPVAGAPTVVTDADRLAKDFGEPLIAQTPSALVMRAAAEKLIPLVCSDESGLQDDSRWCIVRGKG